MLCNTSGSFAMFGFLKKNYAFLEVINLLKWTLMYHYD